MQDIVSRVSEAIRDKLSEIWDSVKRTIEEKWGAIKEWFDQIWQKIKDVFKLDEMTQIGKKMMDKFWDGMKGVWNDITTGLVESRERLAMLSTKLLMERKTYLVRLKTTQKRKRRKIPLAR